MIKRILFQAMARLLFPDIAAGMRQQGAFDPFAATFTDDDIKQCCHVEDRASPATIFCFAGGAVLYAGLPTFEFRRVLQEAGNSFNLVFFRDIRRMGYHRAPDGGDNGLEFYQAKVRELVRRIGSKHHVALGSSHGGSAAFYFGVRCGLDQIVTFNPVVQERDYAGPQALARIVFSRAFLAAPGQAMKNMALTMGAQHILGSMRSTFGEDRLWDVLGTYRDCLPARPPATVFYGTGSPLDALQASRLRHFPEVTLRGLPYSGHNCGAYLKRRGELGAAVLESIRKNMA